MTHSKTEEANDVVRTKTARACDSCIRKRAHWFCAADNAFFCQACDSSVHSANPLARRHHRVRLKTTSFNSLNNNNIICVPSWHNGFTKKSRTPRHAKRTHKKNPFDVVPEVGCCDDPNSHEESVEEFLCRVPICTKTSCSMASPEQVTNIESLLEMGIENECVGMEGLGMVDAKEEECSLWDNEKVKVEEEKMREEGFELMGFDCDDAWHDGEFKENDEAKRKKKRLLLELDYEAVITAWTSQKSAWTTTSDKPDLGIHHCWPQCTVFGVTHYKGTCGMEFHQPYSELGGLFGCHPAMADGEREARVSRYREKRRTRLFSKKIRYEVRKLNAEKRPRMKGRFVKRASFAPPPTFPC